CIVADGSTNEIKAMVGQRMIRVTLADAPPSALLLPGVESVERRGASVILSCSDTDVALRSLLDAFPEARGIGLISAGLEQAFLELTSTNGAGAPAAEVLR